MNIISRHNLCLPWKTLQIKVDRNSTAAWCNVLRKNTDCFKLPRHASTHTSAGHRQWRDVQIWVMLTEVSAAFSCWTRANIARIAVRGLETKVQALFTLRQRNWSFFSVRRTVHTNPEKLSIVNGTFKRFSSLKNWRRLLCVLVALLWTKNIWKEVLFNNNDVTIMRLTLNGVSAAGYFYFYEISSALCQDWKHVFSEWKRRF